MRKISLLIIVLVSTIMFSQSTEKNELVINDKLNVSIPFNGGSFDGSIVVDINGVKTLVISTDGIGKSLKSVQLYIRTEDSTISGMTIDSESTNGKEVTFVISDEQNKILRKTPVRTIGIRNTENGKSIYGTLFNKWVFTDLVPFQIKNNL